MEEHKGERRIIRVGVDRLVDLGLSLAMIERIKERDDVRLLGDELEILVLPGERVWGEGYVTDKKPYHNPTHKMRLIRFCY